ncbi:MAG: hypothetical protein Cons2KO_25980 [Congregibacter sp.]
MNSGKLENSSESAQCSDLATIVVVPRERFSVAPESLQQVLSETPAGVRFVYVEGNPPAGVRSALHAIKDPRVEFIASPAYLSPNQARNIGFASVETKYVVFLDNDVWVEPQWLETLIECAEEEQADVVGPLYLQGSRDRPEVHMAGGDAHIELRDGKRVMRSSHRFQGKPLDDVLPQITRGPTEQIEFHGVVVRSDMLRQLGGLDEGLLCTREHLDFCMSVREAGGSILLEPRSRLTYTRPPPFALSDLRYFSLRWSEDWSVRSLEHFFEKWDLDRGRLPNMMTWTKKQRYRFLEPWYSRTTRWLAKNVGEERVVKVLRYTLYPLEGALNRAANFALGGRQLRVKDARSDQA